jgi:hypothetical protein
MTPHTFTLPLTLGSRTDGTKGDRKPEHLWAMPLVVPLVREGGSFLVAELRNALKVLVSGDQRGSTEQVGVLGQIVIVGKLLGIVDDLFLAVSLRVSVGSKSAIPAALTLSGF